MLRSPAVWSPGLASASPYVTRFGLSNWLFFYLQEAKRYGFVEAGGTTALLSVAGIPGTMLAGTLSDAFFRSRRPPVLLGYGALLLVALVGLCLAPAGSPWWDRACVGGVARHGFDRAFLFWIGAAVVSLAVTIALGRFRRPAPDVPPRV